MYTGGAVAFSVCFASTNQTRDAGEVAIAEALKMISSLAELWIAITHEMYLKLPRTVAGTF